MSKRPKMEEFQHLGGRPASAARRGALCGPARHLPPWNLDEMGIAVAGRELDQAQAGRDGD